MGKERYILLLFMIVNLEIIKSMHLAYKNGQIEKSIRIMVRTKHQGQILVRKTYWNCINKNICLDQIW